ncbi:MAG: YdeI/OmpD-associated family protein [Bacillota bacterium]
MQKYEFDAEIKQPDGADGGAFVLFPYDPLDCFGKKNLIRVECTFEGIAYRGSIANMGAGPCIGILKSIRQQLGKGPGDLVHVVVWKDDAERRIEIPQALAAALDASPEARSFFGSLSYSQQKHYTDWITGAKKAETQAERVSKAIAMLAEGKKLK